MMRRLTGLIVVAMLGGVLAGEAIHVLASPQAALASADWFKLLPDIFLHLIKMIVAPLVITTIIVGITHMGNSSALGRIGLRALVWFLLASIASLSLGLILVNLFEPGAQLREHVGAFVRPDIAKMPDARTFLLESFPTSIIQAMATNNILQILFFALFAGVGLSALGERGKLLVAISEQLAELMLQITHYVMRIAPLAVFGALANIVATKGVGILVTFGKLIGEFYLGLALLWALLIGVGTIFLGRRVFALMRLIREPILIAFSTASSEAALPKMFEQLGRFGVPRRISGFMLPLGYSFNLDGSMMYMSFAAVFIAQAYSVPMGWGVQISMLLTLMLTSKGMASVPRASLVVVTATLATFGLPVEGIALILGIDQFLDMGRTGTNIVGNAIATASIARMEGVLGAENDDATPAELAD